MKENLRFQLDTSLHLFFMAFRICQGAFDFSVFCDFPIFRSIEYWEVLPCIICLDNC